MREPSCWLAGKLTRVTRRTVLALGIGTVYQEVNLLSNMTVAENLFLGWQPMRHGMINNREMVKRSREILSGFGLDIDPTQLLSSYSIAIQQVVAIARAVELAGKVLILDEPTASLDREEIDLLFSVVRKLTERGLAVVFITAFSSIRFLKFPTGRPFCAMGALLVPVSWPV